MIFLRTTHLCIVEVAIVEDPHHHQHRARHLHEVHLPVNQSVLLHLFDHSLLQQSEKHAT